MTITHKSYPKLLLFFLICLFSFTVTIAQTKIDTTAASTYYQKAEVLYKENKPDSSTLYFKKALPLYRKAKVWNKVASCYNKISEGHWSLKEYDLSLKTSYKALEISDYYLNEIHIEKALAYDRIGKNFEVVNSNFKTAMEYYNKALEIKKELFESNHLYIANSYHVLGLISIKTGDYTSANEYLKKAINIRRSKLGENHIEVARSIKALAVLHYKNGEMEKSFKYLQKSLNIANYDSINNYNEISDIHRSIGNIYSKKKAYKKALYHLEKAISFKLKVSKDNLSIPDLFYNNKGIIYTDLGKFEKAIKYYKKSIQSKQKLYGQNHIGLIIAYYNMGVAYIDIGHFDKALECFKKTLVIGEKVLGKDHFELTRSYCSIAHIHIVRKEYEEAFELLNKSLKICVSSIGQYHPRVSGIHQQIGGFYNSQKKYKEAITHFEKALIIDKKVYGDNSSPVASIYNALGELFYLEKKYDKALTYIKYAEKANKIATDSTRNKKNDKFELLRDPFITLKGFNIKVQSLLEMSTKRKNDKYLSQSITICKNANELINHIRKEIYNYKDKVAFSKICQKTYEKSIACQLLLYQKTKDSKALESAFYYMEKGKSNTLREFLNASNVQDFLELPPTLINLIQSLRIDNAFYQSQIKKMHNHSKVDSAKINDYENKLFDINKKQDSITAVLERTYPKYYQFKYNDNLAKISKIQKRLDHRSTLLEFFTTDTITYVLIISKNSMAIQELKTPKLTEKIEEFRNTITSRNIRSYKKTGSQLYKTLITPIKDQFIGDELIIIPDGPLWHLNFDLLLTAESTSQNPEDLPYLLKDYAISYANSANLLFNPFEEQVSDSLEKDCLAFSFSNTDASNTQASKNLSLATLRDTNDDLPGTRKEIRAIANIIDGQYYFGTEASEANFKKKAQDYKILHLALHGEVDNEKPENSKLFFTKSKDTIEDNLLYAHELFALDIPSELTVLSACNTGTGKIAKGEGIMSLGNAFQYAGTKSLLLSSWEVPDDTAPELMKYFYTNLKSGMNKAKALQQAKLSYLKTADRYHKAPFYWGGFYLVGDSSPIEFEGSNFWYWVLGLGILGILLVSAFLYKRK